MTFIAYDILVFMKECMDQEVTTKLMQRFGILKKLLVEQFFKFCQIQKYKINYVLPVISNRSNYVLKMGYFPL